MSEQLTVSTADAATEIFLIDATYGLVEKGIGKKTFDVSPGVYKVRVRSGLAEAEELVIVEPGIGTVTKSFGPLAFSSPVPMPATARSHEYHVDAARRTSLQTHVNDGEGSSIFVFVRHW